MILAQLDNYKLCGNSSTTIPFHIVTAFYTCYAQFWYVDLTGRRSYLDAFLGSTPSTGVGVDLGSMQSHPNHIIPNLLVGYIFLPITPQIRSFSFRLSCLVYFLHHLFKSLTDSSTYHRLSYLFQVLHGGWVFLLGDNNVFFQAFLWHVRVQGGSFGIGRETRCFLWFGATCRATRFTTETTSPWLRCRNLAF